MVDTGAIAKYLLIFILVHIALTTYLVHVHERTHAQVAKYFGYASGSEVFREGAVSTPTYVPVSELNTPKYWAYLAAQSSVEAVGYHLFAILPEISALVSYVIYRLLFG